MVYRAIADNRDNQKPQWMYDTYTTGLMDLVTRRYGHRAARIHVMLETAVWGRPPLPDKQLNPVRQELYREVMYCTARWLEGAMKKSSVTSKMRLFVYDPYAFSSQEFAFTNCAPDGHHMAGQVVVTEAHQLLHRICGDRGETEEGNNRVRDVLFSYTVEALEGAEPSATTIFAGPDPRRSEADTADAETIKRYKQLAQKIHQMRGWKRVNGTVVEIEKSNDDEIPPPQAHEPEA
jgi:hypothetical protein